MTDGEQARKHFVHGFAERLGGVDAAKRQKRGIRDDRYEAVCPTVTGEVRRTAPVHADDVRFARTLTDGPLKITIPGPMTLVDTVVDEAYGNRAELAFAFARAIREEIADLIAAGVDVVQLDEPAFNVYFDEVAAWGIDALDSALSGASCITAVHVCYGYGIPANVQWKANLGERWDQYAHVLPLLAKSTVDQISIELAGSHVPPDVLASRGRQDRRGRRHRRRERPHRNAGRGSRDDRAGAAISARRPHRVLDELRHGADGARRRVREAARAGAKARRGLAGHRLAGVEHQDLHRARTGDVVLVAPALRERAAVVKLDCGAPRAGRPGLRRCETLRPRCAVRGPRRRVGARRGRRPRRRPRDRRYRTPRAPADACC